MAVTAQNLTSGSGTNATSFETASISPAASRLILLSIRNIEAAAATADEPAASGAGLTFTKVRTKTGTDPRRRITVMRALAASPSSGVVTISFTDTQTNCEWSINEFTNVDTTGTNGENAVVQSVDALGEGTDAGITATLAAFADANNATYGAMAANVELSSFAEGSGFTQLSLANPGGGSPFVHAAEWKNSNDTSVDWTWSSSAGIKFAIALEIKFVELPTTSIKKVSGVAHASIKKISGIAIASVKKIGGVA